MTDTPTEEWRDIPGWESKAQISNLGRVRVRHKTSGVIEWDGWKLRKINHQTCYSSCSLHKRPQDKNQKAVYIHQMVAHLWLGPRPHMMEIRHLNGDRRDNRPANLAY